MFNKKTICNIDLKDKKVLVRVDFNVPIVNNEIKNNLRIKSVIPTLRYLLDHGASQIVLISHLGRPGGKNVPALSLFPVVKELSSLLNRPVIFSDQIVGKKVKDILETAPFGSVVLLENLRFSPEEEANSSTFAQRIIEDTQSEIFVQDGFAVVHRSHTSTVQIPKFLPAVAGFLLEEEAKTLTKAMEKTGRKKTLVLIGGSKIADKKPLIDHFLPLANQIVVGGKIAADDYSSTNPKIYVAEDFRTNDKGEKMDIGNLSLAKILNFIDEHNTIIWNGVLGKTELSPFDTSSRIIAEAIGRKDLTKNQTIICGGDTAGFVEDLILSPSKIPNSPHLEYSLISTGGGASLKLLSGLPLPGLESLQDR